VKNLTPKRLENLFTHLFLIRRLKKRLSTENFNKVIVEMNLSSVLTVYEIFIKAEKSDRKLWKEVLKQWREEQIEVKKSLTSSGL
jgi:hypothetical protein